MNRIKRCLRQIQAVRDVATGSEPAYVARSRIGRLCDSTLSLVNDALPTQIRRRSGQAMRDHRSRGIAEVAESCERILGLSRHIRQPSEPLDERWRRGWSDLMTEMNALEQHLLSFAEGLRAEQDPVGTHGSAPRDSPRR